MDKIYAPRGESAAEAKSLGLLFLFGGLGEIYYFLQLN